MLNEFLASIDRYKLFTSNDKLLVAVSGGIDSMVLVDLLSKGKFNFAIAHCNFQLRGMESVGDEKLVIELAKKLNLNYYVKSFDTKKHATEMGVSTQMAARELRYDWFNELVEKHGFDYLITAHHLNDSIETALFNFSKGTGVSGLRGMVIKKGMLVRPMLEILKADILDYAKERNLDWREDASNASLKYKRNFIRKKVIPLLKEINPSLEHSFILTSKRLQSLEVLLDDQISSFKAGFRLEGEHIYINKKLFLSQEWVVLESVLKEYGFNHDHLQNALNVLNDDNVSGKQFDSLAYALNIDRDSIIISPNIEHNESIVEIDKEKSGVLDDIKLWGKEVNDLSISKNPEHVKLDLALLKFPLRLRYWREGDKFQPLGMKGKKKLSDFMIDVKIPLNLKKGVMVLLSENKIVWVVGYRIDDRFKITPNTKKAYSLEIRYDQSI